MVSSLITCLVSWSAGCSCRWSAPIKNILLNSWFNSVITISLLPWLLLLVGPPLSSRTCAVAPLSSSGRFVSLIDSNISSMSSFSSYICVGDIDSILGIAVNNSSSLIGVQSVILFEESFSWYDKSSTIV